MKRKSRIKIISKKRFITNIFVILILGICISFFTSKSFGKKEIHTYKYTVASTDTQDVVKDIKSRNNLADSSIYVGQVLNIPIY